MGLSSDLAGAFQIILAEQQAEERKADKQEKTALALLTMEHSTSQMYLQHNLNMLEWQGKRKSQLEDETMKLGLIGDQLEKVPDIDSGPGAIDGFRTSKDGLEEELKSNEASILELSSNIKNYYAGTNLARLMDKDISGVVDPFEVEGYFEESGLSPDYMEDEAFMHGVRSYTLTPEKILQLKKTRKGIELKEIAIEKARVESQFLPGALEDDKRLRAAQIKDAETRGDYLELQLVDEATLRDQKVDTGNLNYQILEENLLQSKQSTETSKQQVALNNIAIQTAEAAFSNTQYKNDADIRKAHIQSIEEMNINNIQAQSGIGVGILANMSLELDDKTYTPMFSVLSGTVEDEYVKKISEAKNLNLIKNDVLDLYSAYGVGKAEEMIPDYSFVLDKIEEIKNYNSMYNEFSRVYDKELSVVAQRMNRSKYSYEVVQEVAMSADPDLYPLDSIMKAIQWNNTGIYKNMELLESAVTAKDQYKEINSTLERARGLDLTYSAEQTFGIYQETKLPPIQMRFGTTPDQAITPTAQDALFNIFFDEDKAGNLK